jgi:carbon monoxide dehydrogenase subunit G
MRLEQSFEVPVPVAQAWGVLLDLERIAPCMPGATLTSFDGTAFTGNVKVRLGPVSLAYKGSGRITERDEPARRVAFVAQGQDNRGAGAASARVTAVLHAANGGQATLVKVVADIDIAGRAAQFGRGMIADVSGKLIKQFADCLAQTISASPPMAPAAAAASAPIATPPAPGIDAVPPSARPSLTPVFAEPAPTSPTEPVTPATAEYAPLTPTNTAPPEYHPLALQEPPADAAAFAPAPPGPAPSPSPEPQTLSKPESTYAYAPDPQPEPPPPPPSPALPPSPVQPVQPPAASTAAPTHPAPVEAEPIDLLAISGAKGMLRRAAPALVIVALALIGIVVWLALR